MADTNYIVFERNGSGYTEIGRINAPTPKAAMERMAEKIALETERPIENTRYGATPVRNWTELPVGVEVVTRVKVG